MFESILDLQFFEKLKQHSTHSDSKVELSKRFISSRSLGASLKVQKALLFHPSSYS